MKAQSFADMLRFEAAAPLLPTRDTPHCEKIHGRYVVRFARTKEEVNAALTLRFEVFNLERGEGMATSFTTGRDEDEFDSTSHHLILIDPSRGQVIGTCRLRTYEIAKRIEGFYSSTQFDLSTLPVDVLQDGIEFGRACIAKPYRRTPALMLLWKGLELYSLRREKRYIIGCCSMSSQDPAAGGRIFDQLTNEGHSHPNFRVHARPGFKCLWYKAADRHGSVLMMPNLLRTYLDLGAKVCGPPAMVRQFRTIDFFIVVEVNRIDRRNDRQLFGPSEESLNSHVLHK